MIGAIGLCCRSQLSTQGGNARMGWQIQKRKDTLATERLSLGHVAEE